MPEILSVIWNLSTNTSISFIEKNLITTSTKSVVTHSVMPVNSNCNWNGLITENLNQLTVTVTLKCVVTVILIVTENCNWVTKNITELKLSISSNATVPSTTTWIICFSVLKTVYFVDHRISSSAKTSGTRWQRPEDGYRSRRRTWPVHEGGDRCCHWQWPAVLAGMRTLLPAPGITGRRFRLSACLSGIHWVFSVCGDLCCRKRNRATKYLEWRVFLKMNRKLVSA